jgi:CheY-like chemotaxis protein
MAPESWMPGYTPAETILVVDDEPLVCTLLARILREAGYRALEAHCGPDALDQVRQTPYVALVITDIMMPGMTGLELAEAVRRERPALPVLFTSAHTPASLRAHGLRDSDEVLAKPFSPKELLAEVRHHLQKHIA